MLLEIRGSKGTKHTGADPSGNERISTLLNPRVPVREGSEARLGQKDECQDGQALQAGILKKYEVYLNGTGNLL